MSYWHIVRILGAIVRRNSEGLAPLSCQVELEAVETARLIWRLSSPERMGKRKRRNPLGSRCLMRRYVMTPGRPVETVILFLHFPSVVRPAELRPRRSGETPSGLWNARYLSLENRNQSWNFDFDFVSEKPPSSWKKFEKRRAVPLFTRPG